MLVASRSDRVAVAWVNRTPCFLLSKKYFALPSCRTPAFCYGVQRQGGGGSMLQDVTFLMYQSQV